MNQITIPSLTSDFGNTVTGIKTITRIYRDPTTHEFVAHVEVKMQNVPHKVAKSYGSIPLNDLPRLFKNVYASFVEDDINRRIKTVESQLEQRQEEMNLLRARMEEVKSEQLQLKAELLRVKYQD